MTLTPLSFHPPCVWELYRLVGPVSVGVCLCEFRCVPEHMHVYVCACL